MDPRHAKGLIGEQLLLHVLSSKGYFFIESLGFRQSVTRNGFDGVAYNSHLDRLIIYDNKAFKHKSQLTNNQLAKDLQALINIVQLELNRTKTPSMRYTDLTHCLSIQYLRQIT